MNLPEEMRPVVEKSLKEAIAYGNQVANEKTRIDRQAIIDSPRSTVLAMTDTERQLWVEAMKPVWKQFENEIGKELIEAALASNK